MKFIKYMILSLCLISLNSKSDGQTDCLNFRNQVDALFRDSMAQDTRLAEINEAGKKLVTSQNAYGNPNADFITRLSGALHRACLLKYTRNHQHGYQACVQWAQQNGADQRAVCGTD